MVTRPAWKAFAFSGADLLAVDAIGCTNIASVTFMTGQLFVESTCVQLLELAAFPSVSLVTIAHFQLLVVATTLVARRRKVPQMSASGRTGRTTRARRARVASTSSKSSGGQRRAWTTHVHNLLQNALLIIGICLFRILVCLDSSKRFLSRRFGGNDRSVGRRTHFVRRRLNGADDN